VAVGFPTAGAASEARAPDLGAVGTVVAVVAPTILANVVLSNLRDREGAAGRLGRPRARALAAGLLVPAVAAAWSGGPGPRGLLPLPVAMALAVAAFRPGERYGLWAVDGALLGGALLALALPGAGA
jgi:hypothetical protein